MIETKKLIFDSEDIGVYISGNGVYNAPEREYEMVSIPGKNGQLAIDHGRYENIEVTYPCFIWAETQQEFREKMRTIRAKLTSKLGYRRLEDTYHPDEYRMAIYKAGIEVDPVYYNRAGEFELTFDCKPQRFLFSGEEVFTLGEWGETETYSGSIVSFEGNETTAVKSLTAHIVPKQSGSGEPSPSNVRPISGWDAVNVTRAGKNLLVTQPTHAYNFSFDITKVTKVKKGVPYHYSFESVDNATSWRTVLFVWDINGNKITETTGDPNMQNAFSSYPARFYASNLANPYYPEMGNGTIKDFTFTFNQDGYVMFGIFFGNTSDSTVVNNAQLEVGSTATAYEPYNGNTYPISLGQTVYGGTLEVCSGELTIDKVAVDLGSLNWGYNPPSGHELFNTLAPLSDAKLPTTPTADNILCSSYVPVRYGDVYNHTKAFSICLHTNGYVCIYDSRYTDATALKTALNGVYLVYELATPTEITLTPTQVTTLLGNNNIWADSGDVTVEIGQNPNVLVNPTLFEALPIIETQGAGTLTVNNSAVTITNTGKTILDSEMMEAYTEENGAIIPKNDSVSGEFPKLQSGANTVSRTGITSVKITPRWWTL